jgi:hypothetical protein
MLTADDRRMSRKWKYDMKPIYMGEMGKRKVTHVT